NISMSCDAIVKGDLTVPVISAASILAKVTRDRQMLEIEEKYPGYGFASHKGYPTKKHIEALNQLGVLPIHRRTFSPVSKLLTHI
ncbi:MAG: ribonuclease HII, partial [Methylococcales bacterium]|nr:ribonuclease HII [Methylococcales bacterium]